MGIAAFGAYYAFHKPQEAVPEVTAYDELEWLRREFALSPEQMAKIEGLHGEYRPMCDTLCDQVIEARKQLDEKLLLADSVTPELEAELAHFSQVKEKCRLFMLDHVFQVAEVMTPPQRERYLERARMQVTLHDPTDN
jgi:hypothetical protein